MGGYSFLLVFSSGSAGIDTFISDMNYNSVPTRTNGRQLYELDEAEPPSPRSPDTGVFHNDLYEADEMIGDEETTEEFEKT